MQNALEQSHESTYILTSDRETAGNGAENEALALGVETDFKKVTGLITVKISTFKHFGESLMTVKIQDRPI